MESPITSTRGSPGVSRSSGSPTTTKETRAAWMPPSFRRVPTTYASVAWGSSWSIPKPVTSRLPILTEGTTRAPSGRGSLTTNSSRPVGSARGSRNSTASDESRLAPRGLAPTTASGPMCTVSRPRGPSTTMRSSPRSTTRPPTAAVGPPGTSVARAEAAPIPQSSPARPTKASRRRPMAWPSVPAPRGRAGEPQAGAPSSAARSAGSADLASRSRRVPRTTVSCWCPRMASAYAGRARSRSQ